MITARSLTNGTLTVIIDNGAQILTARNDHFRWNELVEAYKAKDEKTLIELINVSSLVKTFSTGLLTVSDNNVLYAGVPLHGVDVDRLKEFLKNGFPEGPLLNYINRKMENPDARAIQEMYPFLEHKNMPLTDRGTFIAYKGVNSDYYSVNNGNEPLRSGKRNNNGQIFNGVGEVIEMVRSYVNSNFNVGCGNGLHCGSLKYALGWGSKVVLVEVDPADVVSVPSDCSCQKMRVCRYKVVGEYLGVELPNAYASDKELNIEPDTYEEPDIEDIFDELESDDLSEESDNSVQYLPQFDNGKRAGLNDALSRRLPVYLSGDDEGADSLEHKNYILGYIEGYRNTSSVH